MELRKYEPQDYIGMFNLKQMERLTIKHYLEKTRLQKNQIAKRLGITERTLQNKIFQHNLL